MFKKYVKKKLQKYVVKYFELHPHVKLIVVAGSVGKTSTKRALGDLLVQRYRVRMHEGNYNSEVSAPLAILGIDLPGNLHSPLAWLGVFRAARRFIVQLIPTLSFRNLASTSRETWRNLAPICVRTSPW